MPENSASQPASEPIPVLVVDDEAPLLRIMKTYLERVGYSVTCCADATSALAHFETSRPSLVVADLTLPDMQGNEMALEMVRKDSNVRVLLCSGYPFDVQELPPELQSRFDVLQKPFVPNMLSGALAGLLNR